MSDTSDRKRDLEARLAALREESPDARKRREEREADDLEALVKASEEHGADRVRGVETSEGMIIVKRPNHMHFRRFMDSKKNDSGELEALVRACVVHPSAKELDRILEEQPASLNRASNAVVELAGHRRDDISGK